MKLLSGVTKHCKSQRQWTKEIQNKNTFNKKHTESKWQNIKICCSSCLPPLSQNRGIFFERFVEDKNEAQTFGGLQALLQNSEH